MGDTEPSFAAVLASAARLQRLVPDAVLVGGSAAAYHARHRVSFDHDHVIADLSTRFESVLEAIEQDDGWVLNRLVPGKIILGALGGIETGVRQMIRTRPLEVEQVALVDGSELRVPTHDEALRIKAFLIVRRNHVRDYLDVAALSDVMGVSRAASVLARIDSYYRDTRAGHLAVASQLVRQLADPRPADAAVIDELASYRSLDERWTWDNVCGALLDLSVAMASEDES